MPRAVYIQLNDHYEVEDEAARNAEEIISILENHFADSLARSEEIANGIMKL